MTESHSSRDGNPDVDGPHIRLSISSCELRREYGFINMALMDPSISLYYTVDGETQRINPTLLVSYVYLEQYLVYKDRYHYRDWVMDSGAFSAYKSGTVIDLQQYIDTCHELLETDPTLSEVYALDVIGDWRATQKNTERMWDQGIPAIPCFHYGEPWGLLKDIAGSHEKIALGGLVGRPKKDQFISQCFARVWPKKVHGFGLANEKLILAYPFHSVDATDWMLGPCVHGRWKSMGGAISMRGSKQPLKLEILWYLDLERRARERWKREMELLDSDEAPTTRLVLGASARTTGTNGPTIFDRSYKLGE